MEAAIFSGDIGACPPSLVLIDIEALREWCLPQMQKGE